jgi:hypothetical protein
MDGWMDGYPLGNVQRLSNKKIQLQLENNHTLDTLKTACHGSQRWTMTFFLFIEESLERKQ